MARADRPLMRSADSGAHAETPWSVAAHRYAVALCAVLLSLTVTSLAQGDPAESPPSPAFEIELAGLAEEYAPGETVQASLSIRMTDPGRVVTQAVAFINVVEAREPWPQAAHLIVADGDVTPDITQRAFEGARWVEGLSAEATVQLKENAPPGSYDLVVQVFRGTNTDPHRVNVDDRIAMKAFRIEITD